ncbi:ABC transporter substrate-binding protein, partial [candidate division KSB1 bacterium]
RQTSEEWMTKVAEEAKKKIREFNPDIVIVFDDNACELVAKQYIDKDLPFVFCGMNGNPEDYGFPAKNITGVTEREWMKESANFIKEIIPDLQTAAILLDSSETALKTTARIVAEGDLPFESYEIYNINYFKDWKQTILELQDSVDAIGLFVYFTLKDTVGELSHNPEDVLSWTLLNNNLPEFAILNFTVEQGALCGYTESGVDQGKAAAEMALEILNGESPGNIPVKTLTDGMPLINESRAKELNILIPDHVLQKAQILK